MTHSHDMVHTHGIHMTLATCQHSTSISLVQLIICYSYSSHYATLIDTTSKMTQLTQPHTAKFLCSHNDTTNTCMGCMHMQGQYHMYVVHTPFLDPLMFDLALEQAQARSTGSRSKGDLSDGSRFIADVGSGGSRAAGEAGEARRACMVNCCEKREFAWWVTGCGGRPMARWDGFPSVPICSHLF